MRLNVILYTIVLGGLISGAIFFVFGYPIKVQEEGNLVVESTGGGQEAYILPIAQTNYIPIRDFTIAEPETSAKSAVLYDVSSGRLLYAKNINQRLPIASVTKLMTAVVIVDSLDLGRIYTVPAESVNVDGLGADIYKGEQIRGDDLLKAMLIKSSNDAALTFDVEAQKLGVDLVAKMNEKARQIGMNDTAFTNTTGLDDPDAFSTAADLIKLVRYASDYDSIAKILTTPASVVSSVDGRFSHALTSTNQLLGLVPGIILGKTGYTDDALGTMAIEVMLGGGDDRLISIVLGTADRFGETMRLIEWAKKAYRWE